MMAEMLRSEGRPAWETVDRQGLVTSDVQAASSATYALEVDPVTELALLRARLDALDSADPGHALASLGWEQMAVMAGLRRPEPIEHLPRDLRQDEEDDYLTLTRSPLFDGRWYLATYADVAASGTDPWLHYLRFGAREGRQPGSAFDGVAYLDANPDVRHAGGNPVLHFHRHGIAEQRELTTPRSSACDAAPICIVADLRSFDEFVAFRETCGRAFSSQTERQILDHVRLHGTQTEFFGRFDASRTMVTGLGLRVDLISGGITSRDRAVGDTILATLRAAGIAEGEARIDGEEAVTPFARTVRERFARSDRSKQSRLPERRHGSGTGPHDGASRRCDLIFSCDALEDAADMDAALSVAARDLVLGGTFVATFPFDPDTEAGLTPASGKQGWDVIARALSAGFADAVMRFVCDQNKGIIAFPENTGSGPRGVFMIICTK